MNRLLRVVAIVMITAPAFGVDCGQYLGMYIYAQDYSQTFLGYLTTDRNHSNSIINSYGTYGSQYSLTSIRNDYCQFGGAYGAYSPYNSNSINPPIIYSYSALSGYKAQAYLTKNQYKTPRVDPDDLISYLQNPNQPADGIEIEGTVRYQFSGSNVYLSADKVINYNSATSRSGTLRLELWASSLPYHGGSISGWRMATYSLGTLDGGYQFTNPSRTVSIETYPPYGSYYMTMMLTEWSGYEYLIIDHAPFNNVYTRQAPSLWGDFTLVSGWLNGWLGWIVEITPSFIYHYNLGYLYVSGQSNQSLWFFFGSQGIGWAWTSKSTYPYFYNPGRGWLWHYPNSNWFLDLQTSKWIVY